MNTSSISVWVELTNYRRHTRQRIYNVRCDNLDISCYDALADVMNSVVFTMEMFSNQHLVPRQYKVRIESNKPGPAASESIYKELTEADYNRVMKVVKSHGYTMRPTERCNATEAEIETDEDRKKKRPKKREAASSFLSRVKCDAGDWGFHYRQGIHGERPNFKKLIGEFDEKGTFAQHDVLLEALYDAHPKLEELRVELGNYEKIGQVMETFWDLCFKNKLCNPPKDYLGRHLKMCSPTMGSVTHLLSGLHERLLRLESLSFYPRGQAYPAEYMTTAQSRVEVSWFLTRVRDTWGDRSIHGSPSYAQTIDDFDTLLSEAEQSAAYDEIYGMFGTGVDSAWQDGMPVEPWLADDIVGHLRMMLNRHRQASQY